jgi:hypothetical protein
MEREITVWAELQKMKEKMDQVWGNLFEESPITKEQEIWQWVEKLPKFEGRGRRNLKSRPNKAIRF